MLQLPPVASSSLVTGGAYFGLDTNDSLYTASDGIFCAPALSQFRQPFENTTTVGHTQQPKASRTLFAPAKSSPFHGDDFAGAKSYSGSPNSSLESLITENKRFGSAVAPKTDVSDPLSGEENIQWRRGGRALLPSLYDFQDELNPQPAPLHGLHLKAEAVSMVQDYTSSPFVRMGFEPPVCERRAEGNMRLLINFY